MDPLALEARRVDLLLRQQAAHFAVALDGRLRSAAALNDLFFALVEALRPDAFLEVGAFEAAASRRVKAAVPGARVVAFEASPVNFAHHGAAHDFAGLGVDYRNQAVSDRAGTVSLQLNLPDDGSEPVAVGSTSILRHVEAEGVREVEVPATTLDAAVGDAARVALWVDVEGAAGMVLDGGRSALGRVEVLKIEVEDAEIWEGQTLAVDLIARLLAHGLLPVARDVEYASQYNLLCLSDRAMRRHDVNQLLGAHLFRVVHELSREPGRLRRSESLRKVARPVRRAVARARER